MWCSQPGPPEGPHSLQLGGNRRGQEDLTDQTVQHRSQSVTQRRETEEVLCPRRGVRPVFPDILDICAPVPCPGSEQSPGGGRGGEQELLAPCTETGTGMKGQGRLSVGSRALQEALALRESHCLTLGSRNGSGASSPQRYLGFTALHGSSARGPSVPLVPHPSFQQHNRTGQTLRAHRRPLLSSNTLFPNCWADQPGRAAGHLLASHQQPRSQPAVPRPWHSVLRTSSKRVPKEVPAGLPTKGSVPVSQPTGGGPVPRGVPSAHPVSSLCPVPGPCQHGPAVGWQPARLPVLRHLQGEMGITLTDHLRLNNSNYTRAVLPMALHRCPTNHSTVAQ